MNASSNVKFVTASHARRAPTPATMIAKAGTARCQGRVLRPALGRTAEEVNARLYKGSPSSSASREPLRPRGARDLLWLVDAAESFGQTTWGWTGSRTGAGSPGRGG